MGYTVQYLVITAVLGIRVFWDVMLLDSVSGPRRFEGTYCLHSQGVKWMKMRHISQYRDPQLNRCENFIPLLPS